MDSRQQIQTTLRNGNLHVQLEGQFTPATAEELTSAIAQVYRGKGNIFIHTAKITSVSPDSRNTFAQCINVSGLPQQNVYLTGSKGLDFSPDNIRVIVHKQKKNGCCGRCRDCRCHNDN